MKVTKSITRAAVIAALYVVLTVAFFATSFSTLAVQFRPSEALMILPLFMWEAVPGLWIGCLLANIIYGNIIDIFFGSFATLLAAGLTYLIGRVFKKTPLRLVLGILSPIIINALLVPMTFTIFIGEPEAYWLQFAFVLAGESAVVILLGVPLYFGLRPAIARMYGSRPRAVAANTAGGGENVTIQPPDKPDGVEAPSDG